MRETHLPQMFVCIWQANQKLSNNTLSIKKVVAALL